MLLYIIIALTCQVTISHGFLDDCPIDREQRIGDVPVVCVLEKFRKDLLYVQAMTELRRSRDYKDLVDEMSEMATDPDRETISAARAYGLFSEVMRALEENRIRDADSLIFENGSESFIDDWILTYFYFFEAEAKRLLGEFEEAAKSVLTSFLERRNSRGISLNQLERLDGLLTLQKVHQFNKDVDRLYGLRDSPNYQLLRFVHLTTKDLLTELHEARRVIFDRLFHTQPRIDTSLSGAFIDTFHLMKRLDLSLDDFRGQSVPITSAESILCEFAQKMNILVDSQNMTASDYSAVINQLRRLDPHLAQEFEDRVIDNIATNITLAREIVGSMWDDYYSADYDQGDIKAIFVAYFQIELKHLQSAEGCNIWALDSLNFVNFILRDLRNDNDGLSLDKLAELEAKITLHHINCFHERVKLVYELDGGESEQELMVKRTQLGDSCVRKLPESELLQ